MHPQKDQDQFQAWLASHMHACAGVCQRVRMHTHQQACAGTCLFATSHAYHFTDHSGAFQSTFRKTSVGVFY